MINEIKKAIAQNTTTDIVEVQSPETKLNTILSEKKLIFNGKSINPIEIIDSKTLLEQELPPIRFTIEKILPQGLFILAGSSKVGKSWLSLDFCQSVATGEQVWNLNANKGTVLYLALEDSLIRLQTRLRKYSEHGESNLFFSVRALKIRDGLIAQIKDFIKNYPDTNLIIIDTMQHIRNNSSDKNAYVNDYNDMNILRQITNEFNVSLVLVTHTRKLDDPDPLNIISGSTGLVGAVDGVFILEKDTRTGNSAKLTISNRDTDGHVFRLEFNKETCHWRFVEEESETTEVEPLYIFLDELLAKNTFWSGTASELCEEYSRIYSKKYVPATITKKLKSGLEILRQNYNITCAFKTEKNTKLIRLFRKVVESEQE